MKKLINIIVEFATIASIYTPLFMIADYMY